MRRVFAGVVVLAIASSCALYQPSERESGGGIALPNTFQMYEPGQAVPSAWWRGFDSVELDALVRRALSSNLTVAQARSRLAQAAAVARMRGASRLPAASVEAGASVTELGEPVVQGGDTRSESYDLTLAVSYEVDLWGRVAANAEAAGNEWEAAAADLLASRLSVTAELALRYFDLLAVRAEQDLLAAQTDANSRLLSLLELRYRRGQATGVDVLRQRAALQELVSRMAPLSMSEAQHRNQICTLVGKAAGMPLTIDGRELPLLPPLPEAGLPADLLAQRPDIQAAGLRLRAADWSVSAARADRLPAVRLSASAGWSSDEMASLLDDWLARLAGSLVGPVFDAGMRVAEVERTRAVADHRLAEYRQAVLVAIQEVQDAIASGMHQAERVAALHVQLETTRRLYDDSMRRYRKGMEPYVNVLNALVSVQRLEQQIVDARLAELRYRVGLHRALGGGGDK